MFCKSGSAERLGGLGLAQLNLRQEVWIQTKMGFYCGNLSRKASHSTTSPSVIVRSNSDCSHHLLQT